MFGNKYARNPRFHYYGLVGVWGIVLNRTRRVRSKNNFPAYPFSSKVFPACRNVVFHYHRNYLVHFHLMDVDGHRDYYNYFFEDIAREALHESYRWVSRL